MVTPGLPESSKVKKLAATLNTEFDIVPSPNGIIGVQQSLKKRIVRCLTSLTQKSGSDVIPTTIRIKLTGDGTRIGRGFNVVNFAFTIIEKNSQPGSVLGNHAVSVMKISESYDELTDGLKDICNEAKTLKAVTVDGKEYNLQ